MSFCHYSLNSPEPKVSSSLTFQYLEKKNRKIWKIEKLRENNVEKLGKKLPDKNDPKMGSYNNDDEEVKKQIPS